MKIEPEDVVKKGDGFVLAEHRRSGSTPARTRCRRAAATSSTPTTVVEEYGADSLRLYEMFMGPLEAVKPWSMKGVEGVYRFLGRVWRMIVDDEAEEIRLDPRVQDVEPTREQAKIVARTIAAVTDDLEAMRFNTAISRLMEFTNAFTGQDVRPKSAMETFVLLLAPMAPHLAEELWELLGHDGDAGLRALADLRPRAAQGRRDRDPGPGQRQAASRVVVPADADAGTSRPPPGPTSGSRRCSPARRSARSSWSRASSSISSSTAIDRSGRVRPDGESMARSRYIVGIDLGTTNCAVAYVDTKGRERPAADIRVFEVPQLVAAGRDGPAADAPLVPLPARGARAAPGRPALPWSEGADRIVGEFARIQGARVPGHLVASAKSWLCHPGRRSRGRHPPLGRARRGRARSRPSRPRPTTCATSATPGITPSPATTRRTGSSSRRSS